MDEKRSLVFHETLKAAVGKAHVCQTSHPLAETESEPSQFPSIGHLARDSEIRKGIRPYCDIKRLQNQPASGRTFWVSGVEYLHCRARGLHLRRNRNHSICIGCGIDSEKVESEPCFGTNSEFRRCPNFVLTSGAIAGKIMSVDVILGSSQSERHRVVCRFVAKRGGGNGKVSKAAEAGSNQYFNNRPADARSRNVAFAIFGDETASGGRKTMPFNSFKKPR